MCCFKLLYILTNGLTPAKARGEHKNPGLAWRERQIEGGQATKACEASQSVRHTPARRVHDDSSQTTGDDTGAGKRDDPTHIDPGDHSPVDRSPSAVAKSNTDGSTSNTLGGGDGELCKCDMLASGLVMMWD